MVKMELFKIASKVYMNIITIETKSWSPKVNNLLGLETSLNQSGDYGIAKWLLGTTNWTSPVLWDIPITKG
jgi:hypothetical protein